MSISTKVSLSLLAIILASAARATLLLTGAGNANPAGYSGPPPPPINSTWDPTYNTAYTYSNSNLTVTNSTTGYWLTLTQPTAYNIGTAGTGKVYFELTPTGFQSGSAYALGLAPHTGSSSNGGLSGYSNLTYLADGEFYVGRGTVNNIAPMVSGTVIAWAIDLATQQVWTKVGCGGQWNNSGSGDPVAEVAGISTLGGASFIAANMVIGYADNAPDSGAVTTVNTGAASWTCTPPTGYSPWH